MGFSLINHPFGGTPMTMETPYVYILGETDPAKPSSRRLDRVPTAHQEVRITPQVYVQKPCILQYFLKTHPSCKSSVYFPWEMMFCWWQKFRGSYPWCKFRTLGFTPGWSHPSLTGMMLIEHSKILQVSENRSWQAGQSIDGGFPIFFWGYLQLSSILNDGIFSVPK